MESVRLLQQHPDWTTVTASAHLDYVNGEGKAEPFHVVVATRGGVEVHLHSARIDGLWQLGRSFWRRDGDGGFLEPEEVDAFLASKVE